MNVRIGSQSGIRSPLRPVCFTSTTRHLRALPARLRIAGTGHQTNTQGLLSRGVAASRRTSIPARGAGPAGGYARRIQNDIATEPTDDLR